jgi:hypothetical protein
MQHAVERRNRAVDVGDDRKVHDGAVQVADIVQPLFVRHDRVDRQADQLDSAPLEVARQQGELTELGRADGSEVARMREQQAQLSPSHVWNSSLPRVVSAVKSGAVSPSRKVISISSIPRVETDSLRRGVRCRSRLGSNGVTGRGPDVG